MIVDRCIAILRGGGSFVERLAALANEVNPTGNPLSDMVAQYMISHYPKTGFAQSSPNIPMTVRQMESGVNFHGSLIRKLRDCAPRAVAARPGLFPGFTSKRVQQTLGKLDDEHKRVLELIKEVRGGRSTIPPAEDLLMHSFLNLMEMLTPEQKKKMEGKIGR